ncbi:hypothetical protein PCE1_004364 [Barthelona sp. PCE]
MGTDTEKKEEVQNEQQNEEQVKEEFEPEKRNVEGEKNASTEDADSITPLLNSFDKSISRGLKDFFRAGVSPVFSHEWINSSELLTNPTKPKPHYYPSFDVTSSTAREPPRLVFTPLSVNVPTSIQFGVTPKKSITNKTKMVTHSSVIEPEVEQHATATETKVPMVSFATTNVKHMIKPICDALAFQQVSTQQRIADLMVSSGRSSGGKDENIRRRVYDVVNVLKALKVVRSVGKIVVFDGYPCSTAEKLLLLEERILRARERRRTLFTDYVRQTAHVLNADVLHAKRIAEVGGKLSKKRRATQMENKHLLSVKKRKKPEQVSVVEPQTRHIRFPFIIAKVAPSARIQLYSDITRKFVRLESTTPLFLLTAKDALHKFLSNTDENFVSRELQMTGQEDVGTVYEARPSQHLVTREQQQIIPALVKHIKKRFDSGVLDS